MPRALLIDLDDTLLDDRGAMAAAVLQLRIERKLAPGMDDGTLVQRWDSVGRELWQVMGQGQVTFQQHRRLRLRRVFQLELSDDDADTLFGAYLEHYERAWSLLPGALEFLEATAHRPRAIVTNSHRPQALRKLAKLGLSSQFTAVITPDDCGVRKPDPRIFLHALDKLGVGPSDAVMIGDNLEADVLPARALGMGAFHVNHLAAGQSIRHAIGAV